MTIKINNSDENAQAENNNRLTDEISKVDSYMAIDGIKRSDFNVSPSELLAAQTTAKSDLNDKLTKPQVKDQAAQNNLEKNIPLPIQASSDISKNPKRKMNKKHLLLELVIGVILLVIGGVSSWYVLRTSEPADLKLVISNKKVEDYKVVSILSTGLVEYTADSKKWQVLTNTTQLKQGYQVRTGIDGKVVLAISDGSEVRLDVASAIRLKKLVTNDVQIENLIGNVYNRVAESKTRKYAMLVDGTAFIAAGTAFQVKNTADLKGVEVYQSKVKVSALAVSEGQAYYLKTGDNTKLKSVQSLDIVVTQKDQFVKWNKELDSKNSEYAKKLGILAESIPLPQESAVVTAGTIKLTGLVSGYALNLAWQTENLDAPKGFKIVYSSKTRTPVYGVNSSEYVSSPNARKTTVIPPEGRTYYIRVCVYDGSTCGAYSNIIKLSTPVKQVEAPTAQTPETALSLSISGSVLTWTVNGSAQNGYKVVASTTKFAPEYPTDGYVVYVSDEMTKSVDISSKLDPGTWNIRICKYTGSGCTDYSNTVKYSKS